MNTPELGFMETRTGGGAGNYKRAILQGNLAYLDRLKTPSRYAFHAVGAAELRS